MIRGAYRKSCRIVRIKIITAFFFFAFIYPAFSQVNEEALGKDFDYFYGIREQIDIDVDVASLFIEDELVVGSTVSRITPLTWKRLGARRTYEALNNEMSVMSYPMLVGSYGIAIRGYANTESISGVATLLDGVPMSGLQHGTAFYFMPNWELGTLNSIELIKGPGSAIYGSDAFHGVLSMKTFESDEDLCAIEAAGAFPLYGDANLLLSHGLYGELIRINASAAASGQEDQEIEYEYDDHGIEGTGKRKNKYNSQSGVMKIDLRPDNKLNINLGTYMHRFEGEDFPGCSIVPENLWDNDVSSQNSLLFIGKGSVLYELPWKISISATGYCWQIDNNSDITVTHPGDYSSFTAKTRRAGLDLIIKQPDNPYNIQWFIAYSYSRILMPVYNYKLYDINESLLRKVTKCPSQGFERDINSIFGQVKYGKIRNRVLFLAGGRLDNYSDFGNQISPRGGIIVLPTEETSIKLLYGRAFKAPTGSQIYGTPPIALGDEDLEPEIIDIYEAAFIYKTGSLKCSLTGFYSSWKNGIIGRVDPDLIIYNARYVNQGENESYGGELEVFYSFNPFAANLGFSYVKSRSFDAQLSDEYGDPLVNADGTIKTGDMYFEAFPEYSFNAGLYYTIENFDLTFFLNNRMYLKMRIFNRPELPAYYRADLNISKNISDASEIFLDVRNLFNKKNKIPSVFAARDGYEEPGTSVMLRANYKL